MANELVRTRNGFLWVSLNCAVAVSAVASVFRRPGGRVVVRLYDGAKILVDEDYWDDWLDWVGIEPEEAEEAST